jgi:hypothetical protein
MAAVGELDAGGLKGATHTIKAAKIKVFRNGGSPGKAGKKVTLFEKQVNQTEYTNRSLSQ